MFVRALLGLFLAFITCVNGSPLPPESNRTPQSSDSGEAHQSAPEKRQTSTATASQTLYPLFSLVPSPSAFAAHATQYQYQSPSSAFSSAYPSNSLSSSSCYPSGNTYYYHTDSSSAATTSSHWDDDGQYHSQCDCTYDNEQPIGTLASSYMSSQSDVAAFDQSITVFWNEQTTSATFTSTIVETTQPYPFPAPSVSWTAYSTSSSASPTSSLGAYDQSSSISVSQQTSFETSTAITTAYPNVFPEPSSSPFSSSSTHSETESMGSGSDSSTALSASASDMSSASLSSLAQSPSSESLVVVTSVSKEWVTVTSTTKHAPLSSWNTAPSISSTSSATSASTTGITTLTRDPSSATTSPTSTESTADSSTDTQSSNSSQVVAVESTTSSSSAPAASSTGYGTLTYELGQHVLMIDIIANNEEYKSSSTDPMEPERRTVNLLTNKPNTAKRRFEIYKPNDAGDWGPNVEESVRMEGLTCDVTFNPGTPANLPTIAVWDTPNWYRTSDPEGKMDEVCKFDTDFV